jgi:hypothetical protein
MQTIYMRVYVVSNGSMTVQYELQKMLKELT